MPERSDTHDPLLQHAPSATRNSAHILQVLEKHLPQTGRVLEIASGSGQHVAAFANAFPGINWLASDPDARARDSIDAWAKLAGSDNLVPALDIDVARARWHEQIGVPLDVILAINLVHIAPWAVTEGLMRGAGELLAPGGLLYLYGPYRKDGTHTADSNIKFEAWLKAQDEAFGVRDIGEMERLGEANGLRLSDVIEMPANNFSLIFRVDQS